MIQAAILILGALGGALYVLGGRFAAAGALVILLGQPCWIIETWRKRQWGMLALSLWWTGVWALGAWKQWGGV